MARIKNGFTLAEVLISLSIIGVISAIMIPQVTIKAQAHKNAMTLSKVVHDVQLGCQNLIQDANDTSAGMTLIHTLMASSSQWSSEIVHYIDAKPQSSSSTYQYKMTKYQAEFDMQSASSVDTYNSDAVVLNMKIDTNGDSKPNVSGKDIFQFDLTNSCKMIPTDDATKEMVKNGYKAK